MTETPMPEAAAVDLPASQPPQPVVRPVTPEMPLQWLKLGWQDMVKSRFRGCVYGLLFVVMGFTISAIYATRWQLTMGMVAGFFLVGPFLACGIYELSRQMARGEKLDLASTLLCWQRNPGPIGFFGVMLTFAMIVWARVSLIVFALFSTTEFPTLQSLAATVFSLGNLEFLAIWTLVGFLFATIVFAIGVVSAPMMLDRGTDAMTAIFASARCLLENPLTLYVWAACIVVLIGGSLLLGFIPLIITAPLVGHATWHAYKACIGWPDDGAGSV